MRSIELAGTGTVVDVVRDRLFEACPVTGSVQSIVTETVRRKCSVRNPTLAGVLTE